MARVVLSVAISMVLGASALAAEDPDEGVDPELVPVPERPADEAPAPSVEPLPERASAAPDNDRDDGSFDIGEVGLEHLLNVESVGGSVGSFGFRLHTQGVKPYVHGYTTFTAYQEGRDPFTFDVHRFAIVVGATVLDIAVPEAQVEYEHGGEQLQVRVLQLDMKWLRDDRIVLRVGKFQAPFGTYNEHRYPEFIAVQTQRTFVHNDLCPVPWPEVGVQLRGRLDWAEDRYFSYAVYVSNGLEQADDDQTEEVEDGGSIRKMRNNLRDRYHSDKAVGGRLGLHPLRWLQFGGSAYTGAYTVDGAQRLSMFGGDFLATPGDLTVAGEAVGAIQTVAVGDPLVKYGFYLLGAYKIRPIFLEPWIQVDGIHLSDADEDNLLRFTGGSNWFPLREKLSSFVIKASYAYVVNRGKDVPDNRVIVQVALGF